jgi:hypothetical protein
MLLEFTGAAAPLTSPRPPPPPVSSDLSCLVSPTYSPVSKEWVPTEGSEGGLSSALPSLKKVGTVACGLPPGPMENITSQVQALEIDAEPACESAAQGIQMTSLEPETVARQFLNEIFPGATTAELAPPGWQRAKIRAWTASTEPSRRSLRKVAVKSVVLSPDSTTNRLIR